MRGGLRRVDVELLVISAFLRVLQRRHAWYRQTALWLQACLRHPRLFKASKVSKGFAWDISKLPEELRSLLW